MLPLPTAEQIFGFTPKEELFKLVYKIPGLGEGIRFLDSAFPGAGGSMLAFTGVLVGGMIVAAIVCDPVLMEIVKKNKKINLIFNVVIWGAGITAFILLI